MKDRSFEAGAWGLTWDEADGADSLQGTARFSMTRGVELEIPIGLLLGDELMPFGSRDERAKFAYGITWKNEHIVLMDCRSGNSSVHFPGTGRQTVNASHLLYSKSSRFDPAAPITKIEIKLQGLIHWYGSSPLETVGACSKDGHFVSFSASLTGESLDEVNLYSDDAYDVALTFRSKISPPSVEGVNIANSCLVRLLSGEPLPFEDALRLTQRLQSFFSFCAGWYAEIEELYFTNNQNERYECVARFLDNPKQPKETDYAQMPFPYRRVGEILPEMVRRWLGAEGDLLGAINVLVPLSLRGDVRNVDLMFLAAAQTFEALARDGRELREMPEEEYTQRVSDVVSQIDNAALAEWTAVKLSHGNFVSQRKLLKGLYRDIGPFAKRVFPNRDKFISRHIALRNDVTHRNPSTASIDSDELFCHTNGVMLLCHAAVMLKLGISPEEIDALMKKSMFRWYLLDRAASHYGK